MTTPANMNAGGGKTIRLDVELGIVSSDGRHSIPWPDYFLAEDWANTQAALNTYSAQKAEIERLREALERLLAFTDGFTQHSFDKPSAKEQARTALKESRP